MATVQDRQRHRECEQHWQDYLRRADRTWGARLDLSSIEDRFLPYFQGPRIRVEDTRDGRVRFGVVGVTTGWRPALILIHRCTDLGSGDVLGPHDVITGIKPHPRSGDYRTVHGTTERTDR